MTRRIRAVKRRTFVGLAILSAAIFAAPGSVFAEGESNYVTGVGKLKGRLIILLDVSKLLHHQEVKRLEEAAETVATVK